MGRGDNTHTTAGCSRKQAHPLGLPLVVGKAFNAVITLKDLLLWFQGEKFNDDVKNDMKNDIG